MALTHNNTEITYRVKVPDGYSRPSITTFTDYELTYKGRTISIAKSGVENASDVVTFTAIIAALNTQIEALINADIDTTGLTVTSFARLTALNTNFDIDNVLYTTGAINYLCIVDIFVKTA